MSRQSDNITENNFTVGYCVRGHDKDPDPNQNGLVGVYLPQHHGNNVPVNHLGFSPVVMPPNQSGATEFNGVPDPGQALLCMRGNEPSGASSLVILGSLPVNRQDGGQAGNLNLNTALSALVTAFGTEINVNIPPTVKEVMESGARIRQIVEKGQLHKHDLLKGIPSHGAMYNLAGMPQKQLTNISTAIQSFSNILTSSMMSAIPGMNFSVGNILSSLTSSVADKLLSSLSPELAQGVQNMFSLMQSMEVNESGSFSTMGKVDPTTYLNNAVSLLTGNQSLGEVVENMKRLQFDTSLFGLDKLANASFSVPTAFGAITLGVSALGAITNETPDVVQKAIQAFTGLMTSGAGFPNATLSNMFGDSAGVMSELFNRLPPDKQTNAKNMMEGVIASGTDPRKLLNNVADIVHTGQNIASLFK